MSPALTTPPFVRPHLNHSYGKHDPEGVNTLPELVEFAAKHNPNHIYGLQFRAGEGSVPREITQRQFRVAMLAASAWLVNNGCTQILGIFLNSDVSTLVYMAALQRLGTPVLQLSARLTPAALAHVLVNSAQELLRSQGHTTTKFQDALDTDALFDLELPAEVPPAYAHHRVEDLDSLIMHSSGSASSYPKLFYHSVTYLLVQASAYNFPKRLNHSASAFRGFGLIPPLLGLSLGMPIALPPASVIPTAKTIYNLIVSTNARYVMLVPSIVEDMFRLNNPSVLEVLRSLELLGVGGAPMKDSVAQEIIEAGVNLVNHCGATEIGAFTFVERKPEGYEWPYINLRQDTDISLIPLDEEKSTAKLVGRAPGWTTYHTLQDVIVVNPKNKHQFKFMGRSDDVIVLATGEKVQPASLERVMTDHPRISNAIAFGESQFCLGLLLEIFSADSGDDVVDTEALLTELEPYLERGNQLVGNHGKVTRDMIIFTQSAKPISRTAKGNVARNATYIAFAKEIAECYQRSESSVSGALPLPHFEIKNGDVLKRSLRGHIATAMNLPEPLPFGDDKDFFEYGMDSLQATRLRRAFLNKFVVNKLFHSISHLMVHGDNKEAVDPEEQRISAMHRMVEHYSQELNTVFDHLVSESSKVNGVHQKQASGNVVILTGSTGSMGCFVLANLVKNPAISKVICFNRPSPDIRQRQESLCKRRGSVISDWEKVVFYEVDLSQVNFGLDKAQYEELYQASHIIHTAWPVNFSRNLSSLEAHVKGVVNLIRLSLSSGVSRGHPTRLTFVSSIAVVGRYSAQHPGQPIPEKDIDASSNLPMGYAESKWVCERLVAFASEKSKSHPSFPVPFEGTSVRVGQLSGSEATGSWTEDEHIPMIFRTSSALKCLPEVDGTLSWIPSNVAADTMVDITFADQLKPFYHLENPCRQSWSDVLHVFSKLTGPPGEPLPIVPFPEWMRLIPTLGDDVEKNSALKIMGFLELEFLTMAKGDVVLDVSNTLTDSKTLREVGPLDESHFKKYLEYWNLYVSST
ncbi:hypothetical protein BDQ17DRAFT_1364270 [Cyathus striatus]|nr:hypothetical protein BDQ17DRAFT_1364270 [Cyathus striatus]